MICPKYVGFADRDAIAKEYAEGTGSTWGSDFKIATDFPTEAQILYASYEQGGYEGWSVVLFKRGGKLYEVSGSHCSCYGLEGQWKPEETTWAAIAMRKPDTYGLPLGVITEAQKRAKRQKKA